MIFLKFKKIEETNTASSYHKTTKIQVHCSTCICNYQNSVKWKIVNSIMKKKKYRGLKKVPEKRHPKPSPMAADYEL